VPLPSTTVTSVDAPPVLSAVLDSTQAFVAVEMFRGPTAPQKIVSPSQLAKTYERTGVGIPGFDVVDILIREGVPTVYVARVVGPGAVAASANLAGSSGTSLVVTAKEPGEWGNGTTGGLAVDTDVSGGLVTVKIYRNGAIVEQSPALGTRADIVAWSLTTSKWVNITLGADTTLPVATGSATNLAGGNADLVNVTPTHVRQALDRFGADLGSGQVLIPGRTTVASSTEALEHCAARNRVALLESDDSLNATATAAVAAQLRALGSGAEGISRLGGLWAQRATGPGVTPGTTRSVPWTVQVAGLIAKREAIEGHPNVMPIEDFGVPVWATGLSREWSPADAELIHDAGCNVARMFLGRPRNISFDSLDDPDASLWSELSHSRVERVITVNAYDIGRKFAGRQIDGQGLLFNDFKSALKQILTELWQRGALYGETPADAFVVDVGPTQNTTETIEAREVRAAIGIKLSPHALFVEIELSRVPLAQDF
jgi:hypothetical protein